MFNKKLRNNINHLPKRNILIEVFKTLKFKKSTKKMLKESDKLLYN